MKVRIIIWSVVGLLVAAGVVILATNKSLPGGVEPEFSRDDLLAYAGRLEGRLNQTHNRFEKAAADAPANPAADSLRAAYFEEVAACRALVDSIAMAPDVTAALGMKERADARYARAKDWLIMLEGLGRTSESDRTD